MYFSSYELKKLSSSLVTLILIRNTSETFLQSLLLIIYSLDKLICLSAKECSVVKFSKSFIGTLNLSAALCFASSTALFENEKKPMSSIFTSSCKYSSILFNINVVLPVPGGPMITMGLLTFDSSPYG